MTTAATKPKADQAEPTELLWPGPPLHGTHYELVLERDSVREVIAIGRRLNTRNGNEGLIRAITYVGDGVIRVTIGSDRGSDRDSHVDLFGHWMGVVSPTGEKFHKPIFVSPDVAAARRVLGKLSQADRAQVLDGYTPKPAA